MAWTYLQQYRSVDDELKAFDAVTLDRSVPCSTAIRSINSRHWRSDRSNRWTPREAQSTVWPDRGFVGFFAFWRPNLNPAHD